MDSTQILPNTLRYGTPPTMPQARSYTYEEPATETSYFVKEGTIVQINIPRLQRSYLSKSSELKFRITVTSTEALDICLDTAGGYSLINTIEVYDYLGSTLLERTDGVGQLASFLLDFPETGSSLTPYNESMLGTTAVTLYEPYVNSQVTVGPGVSGAPFRFGTIQNGLYVSSLEVSLPLLSFLGSLSTKLAPLHNGYTLLLKLNSSLKALGVSLSSGLDQPTTGIQNAYLSNVFMKCDILELGPTAEAMVLSSVGEGPVILPTKALRNYSFSDSGVTSTANVRTEQRLYTFPLNINVSSMTSLWWFMRPQSTQNDINLRSLSQRIRNNLVSWSFVYGSSTLPSSKGIQCAPNYIPVTEIENRQDYYANFAGSQAYAELLKSRRITETPFVTSTSWSVNGYDSLYLGVGGKDYARALNVLTPTPLGEILGQTDPFVVQPPGKFACGLSTDLLPEKDNQVVTGLNTNGMATSIQATFNPTPNFSGVVPDGANNATTFAYLVSVGTQRVLPFVLDAYVEYDAFISILPNISTTVSF